MNKSVVVFFEGQRIYLTKMIELYPYFYMVKKAAKLRSSS